MQDEERDAQRGTTLELERQGLARPLAHAVLRRSQVNEVRRVRDHQRLPRLPPRVDVRVDAVRFERLRAVLPRTRGEYLEHVRAVVLGNPEGRMQALVHTDVRADPRFHSASSSSVIPSVRLGTSAASHSDSRSRQSRATSALRLATAAIGDATSTPRRDVGLFTHGC
jgi:hypothetical protein